MKPNNRNSNELAESLRLLEEPRMRLSAGRRGRILRESMASRALAAGETRSLGIPALAWTSAVAVALIVAFATPATMSGLVPDGSGRSAVASGPRLVMADYQEGQMIMVWENGDRERYTVRQANDIRSVRQAPGVEVEGHRFVDLAPSDERVVFYMVE